MTSFYYIFFFSVGGWWGFKGIVSIKDESHPVIVQAVYDLYDIETIENEKEAIDGTRFIFIGKFFVFEDVRV